MKRCLDCGQRFERLSSLNLCSECQENMDREEREADKLIDKELIKNNIELEEEDLLNDILSGIDF